VLYNTGMKPEWLIRITSWEHLALLFSDLLLISTILLADGWALVLLSREVGLYAALALHGTVALIAALILGNSVHRQLKRIRREAEEGVFRPAHYARLVAVVIAAVLLIIPGTVSDGLGLFIFLPPGRHLVGWIVARRYSPALVMVYEYFKMSVFSDIDEQP